MRRLTLAFLLALAASCGRNASPVAMVGDLSLSARDVDLAATRVGKDRAVASAVDTALLFEGAKRRGLLDDAAVKARADDAYRQALGQALVEKTMSDASTDAKLKETYEAEKASLAKRQVHVAHIVIHVSPASPARIGNVLARLRAGEKFDAVARDVSEDAVSAARGGELAPLKEGQVDPQFFEAAFKLHKGETSDVVTTPYGQHIILALDDPATVVPTFAEARSKLAASAMAGARKALLESLRAEIPVTLHEKSAIVKEAASP